MTAVIVAPPDSRLLATLYSMWKFVARLSSGSIMAAPARALFRPPRQDSSRGDVLGWPPTARPRRFLRNTHGAMGFPCQQVDDGTCSPRITSDAGPTVAPVPGRAVGSAALCGPGVAPDSRTTVPVRMIRSWNKCV